MTAEYFRSSHFRSKTKPYFFCARIHTSQQKKLNAFMYTSDSTHAVFINGILGVFDMLCTTGQDEILRQIFGNEFYMKFFNDYLENLYQIEQKTETTEVANGIT